MVRYFRSPQAQAESATALGFRLKLFFGGIFLAILLTTMRCAYRLSELHAGYRGGLIKDESLFIGLEGV